MYSPKIFLVLILATYFSPLCSTSRLISSEDIGAGGSAQAPATYYPLRTLIKYYVIDNSTSPGNSVFETNIGDMYALLTLRTANEFVLNTLYKGQKPQDGNDYLNVTLVVESFNDANLGIYPVEVASTVENNIRLNTDYIQLFQGDVFGEFTGILYHESTHVWQWHADGLAPTGLITGIADFVRLTGGYPSMRWLSRGCGDRWDQGFEVTAYFLEFCESLSKGFVATLNGLMFDNYTDKFFDILLGKSVDELWGEYKGNYIFRPPRCAIP